MFEYTLEYNSPIKYINPRRQCESTHYPSSVVCVPRLMCTVHTNHTIEQRSVVTNGSVVHSTDNTHLMREDPETGLQRGGTALTS